MNEKENSYFDGGLLQLIGWNILGWLVTICTFWICYPWSFTMVYRWESKHTVINGKRLKFDGTALQLFGNWIKWLLLTIITFGIYGFWIPIKLKKWKIKHTSFVEDETIVIHKESEQINKLSTDETSLNESSSLKNVIKFAVIPFLIIVLPMIGYEFDFVLPIDKFFKLFSIGNFKFGIDTFSIVAVISIFVIEIIKKYSVKESIILGLGASAGTLIYYLRVLFLNISLVMRNNLPFEKDLYIYRLLSLIFYTLLFTGCSAGIGFLVKKINEKKLNKKL